MFRTVKALPNQAMEHTFSRLVALSSLAIPEPEFSNNLSKSSAVTMPSSGTPSEACHANRKKWRQYLNIRFLGSFHRKMVVVEKLMR